MLYSLPFCTYFGHQHLYRSCIILTDIILLEFYVFYKYLHKDGFYIVTCHNKNIFMCSGATLNLTLSIYKLRTKYPTVLHKYNLKKPIDSSNSITENINI